MTTKKSEPPTLELICGPSCIGKTTFSENIDSKYCSEKLHIHNIQDDLLQLQDININQPRRRSGELVLHFVEQMVLLSKKAFKKVTPELLNWIYMFDSNLSIFFNYRIKGPPKWDHRWDVIKDHPIKKRAIILCTSESEWHRRIEERKDSRQGPPRLHSLGTFYNNYKDTYIKWIEELDRYNVPYIFIENKKENNYPVLHKSAFLKMLDEPCLKKAGIWREGEPQDVLQDIPKEMDKMHRDYYLQR